MTLPRVLYDNHAHDDSPTVTPSTEDTGYDGDNALDWRPYTYWRPTATGVSTLQMVFASDVDVDACGIYAHDLGTNGGSVKLQYSTNSGGAWNDAFAAVSPTGSEVIYKRFSKISADYWRLHVDSNPVSFIGVLAFGQETEMEQGFPAGYAPGALGRATKSRTNMSHGGKFLGSSVFRDGVEFDIQLDNLSPTFTRNTLLSFAQHADAAPFFLQWNYADWPGDAVFAWATRESGSMPFSRAHRHKFSMPCRGVFE